MNPAPLVPIKTPYRRVTPAAGGQNVAHQNAGRRKKNKTSESEHINDKIETRAFQFIGPYNGPGRTVLARILLISFWNSFICQTDHHVAQAIDYFRQNRVIEFFRRV